MLKYPWISTIDWLKYTENSCCLPEKRLHSCVGFKAGMGNAAAEKVMAAILKCCRGTYELLF